MEQRLLGVCQRINEQPIAKKLQSLFHENFGRHWVRISTSNLLRVHGDEHIRNLEPETGVLVCSNHRSFFDMYVISAILRNFRKPWVNDMYFPVRSNFFYETWSGLVVNLVMGGGAMYPPIFRDRSKADLNRVSVERVVAFLQKPGVIVGMHPEGTRGKGPDPYELLPAQPGVGQMALQSGAIVVPVWIQGLRNNFPKQIASNWNHRDRDANRIDVVFGRPVDLSDLREQKPRVTLYKRAADRILGEIAKLGASRRAPRARHTKLQNSI